MDEEMIVVQEPEENYDEATVEDLELDIEQTETVEYIEVDEPEEITINIEEGFGSPSTGDGNYAPLDHTHPISQVEELSGTLHKLASVKDYYSAHGGYAEFQEWKSDGYYKTDKTYENTGGVGFFVSLVKETGNISGGNLRIDICKKEGADGTIGVEDVYGVTVDNSGFCGNQDKEYDLLDTQSPNKDNPSYAKVCLLGNVKVRVTSEDHLKIAVGDYVIPNNLGYASKSENGVGFKVISKGQIASVGSTTTAWYYVDIALVPQNDNIARVMSEIEKTNASLENVNVQLDTMSGTIDEVKDITVSINGKVDGFEGVVNDTNAKVNAQSVVVQKTKEIAEEANQKVNEAVLEYAEAVSVANEAKRDVEGVLVDIGDIKEDIEPLAEWKGKDGTYGVAGFVAQANKDSVTLAEMTEAFSENGSDLTAIIQKIDENGAAIQHLVSHVDKYILGNKSPTYDLTIDEMTMMQPGIIYVPTKDYTEEHKEQAEYSNVDFKYGMSYIWKVNHTGMYVWSEYKKVFTFSDDIGFNNIELKNEDLWHCWQGVLFGDRYLYSPGTLYCWDGKMWIPVASENDGTSSVVSLINQTAKKLTSTYTNIKGDISIIEQDIKEIRTIVGSTESGSISTIEQAAERIMMGTYNPDGSSSLGLLLDGMTSNSIKANVVEIKTVEATPPSNVVRYDYAPTWNGTEFVPVGDPSETGEYYFDPSDVAPFTYYCRVINDDSYAIYGINNVAMASLNTRVTDATSEVESWTRFQKGQNETITSINQTSDEAGAAISSMVFGDFRECVVIKLELTDAEKTTIAADRYAEQPLWKDGKFVFDGNEVENGEYCLAADGNEAYYKLLYRDGEVIGYERYEMKSSPYSAIVQKVDENGTSIGLVTGDDSAMGSLVVKTINDKSEVRIDADKIGINGTSIFRDTSRYETTTISGDFIRTGIITSNNYNGPATYTRYGVKIVDNKIVASKNSSDCVWFAEIETGKAYELLPFDGEHIYYIGASVNVDTELTVLTEDYLAEPSYHCYIIGTNDFDLSSNESKITGTKFDLNNGTIFSQNLTLDREGDLTITGRITATSGYIGDAENGFTIDKRSTGIYYLANNQRSITGDGDGQSGGVYIAPDGIGLGNGNFYVNNNGNLTTNGTITMRSKGETVVSINNGSLDLAGNISMDGNINMGGSLVLGGSITWSADSTPMRILYAKTALAKPDKPLLNENGDPNYVVNATDDVWHTQYQAEEDKSKNWAPDYFASYSYDGGLTWTDAIKIRGEDGENGIDGDAGVDEEFIFDMLTEGGEEQGIFPFYAANPFDADNPTPQLYINAKYIRSGTLSGIQLISEVADENIVDINEGRIYFKTNREADPKLRLGYGTSGSAFAPYIMFGAGTSGDDIVSSGVPFRNGAITMYKIPQFFGMQFLDSDGGYHTIRLCDKLYGQTKGIELESDNRIKLKAQTVDFTEATNVTGLKITFG